MKVQAEPGFTSEDLLDVVTPHAKRKPDIMILHIGSNDLTALEDVDGKKEKKIIDTERNIVKLRDTIHKHSPKTEVVLSLPTPRYDDEKMTGRSENKDIARRTEKLCKRLVETCEREKIKTLVHSNFNKTHLGKGQLHPNGPGKGLLARNFIDFIDKY